MFEHAMSNTGSEHTENVLQNFVMLKQKAEKNVAPFCTNGGGGGALGVKGHLLLYPINQTGHSLVVVADQTAHR